jgi:hypothetical protein
MQTEDEQLILKKAKKAEYLKLYREKNKDILKSKRIEYDKTYSKNYRINNKEKIKQAQKTYQNEYQKNRKKIDPLFKLRHTLSNRIQIALKNKKIIKSQSTLNMIGCDLKTIKSHLEKQFTKGMNWGNQGAWHIDHIIPCALAKTEEELIKLFHYTNLQPLWAMDNWIKSDKILEKQLFLL